MTLAPRERSRHSEFGMHAPLLYHGSARAGKLTADLVAVPLSALINRRDGSIRYRSKEDLAKQFGFSISSNVIVSGTDDDPVIERYWSLPARGSIGAQLATIGVNLVTIPNFSLPSDVPRWDNLYNMKRIAIVSKELSAGGIPCALHVNARTDRDWDRWIEFLDAHEDISFIAFEFATGARSRQRMPWYVDRLCELGEAVRRPLGLVVRGGLPVMSTLGSAFSGISFIDTTSFLKTQARRRLAFSPQSGISESPNPTSLGEPLDELLDENVRVMRRALVSQLARH